MEQCLAGWRGEEGEEDYRSTHIPQETVEINMSSFPTMNEKHHIDSLQFTNFSVTRDTPGKHRVKAAKPPKCPSTPAPSVVEAIHPTISIARAKPATIVPYFFLQVFIGHGRSKLNWYSSCQIDRKATGAKSWQIKWSYWIDYVFCLHWKREDASSKG